MWFVARDVADVLGYGDAEAMTRRLDADKKQNLEIVGFGPRGRIHHQRVRPLHGDPGQPQAGGEVVQKVGHVRSPAIDT